jgi:hypothetical protein
MIQDRVVIISGIRFKERGVGFSSLGSSRHDEPRLIQHREFRHLEPMSPGSIPERYGEPFHTAGRTN